MASRAAARCVTAAITLARSAELLTSPLMTQLKWLRVPGDLMFGAGMALLAYFVIGLKAGWSLQPAANESTPATSAAGVALGAG